jgi:hypothetical protein
MCVPCHFPEQTFQPSAYQQAVTFSLWPPIFCSSTFPKINAHLDTSYTLVTYLQTIIYPPHFDTPRRTLAYLSACFTRRPSAYFSTRPLDQRTPRRIELILTVTNTDPLFTHRGPSHKPNPSNCLQKTHSSPALRKVFQTPPLLARIHPTSSQSSSTTLVSFNSALACPLCVLPGPCSLGGALKKHLRVPIPSCG